MEVFSYRSRTSRLKQAPGASRAQKAGRESEFFYLNEFGSIEQLADGIQGYIRYYNEERIPSETEEPVRLLFVLREAANFWGSVHFLDGRHPSCLC